MIDLKFGLFWSGSELSYLRYLTFASLRKFHPNSTIELYVTDQYAKDGFKWGVEQQDFQSKDFAQTIPMQRLLDIGVAVKPFDKFGQYSPNYQSDFFRWWWIQENGGFYLDTDQIILRSFDSIDRNCDFIFSAYQAPSCGLYTPVGVVGGSKTSEIVGWINKLLPQYYEPNNYNSLGPFMLRSVLTSRKWRDKMYNTPSRMFYPLKDSCMVGALYGGQQNVSGLMEHIQAESYAVHWFGGHPASQTFNRQYTEEKAKTSLDLMSAILRDKGIV